jgi:uncharacterized protein
MSRLRIDVADLLSHPGSRRHVLLTETVEDLAGSVATVVDPLTLDLDLDHVSEGIVVRGRVSATWRAECSRCLTDLAEPLELHVEELFEAHPVPGETYPLEGHELDLDQMVRDSVLLAFPLAPRCATPCLPDAPGDDPSADAAPVDPRWAVLSELEI